MAKGKKKSAGSTASSKSANRAVIKQARVLIGVVLFLFLFAAIFDRAGALGSWIHGLLFSFVGTATPLLSVLLLWYGAFKLLHKKLNWNIRFVTIAGLILFAMSFTGILAAVGSTVGSTGGWLGSTIAEMVLGLFGGIIGRLILFVLAFIALTLILDKAVLAFLTKDADEEEVEEESNYADAEVPVKGEVKTGGLFGLKKQAPAKAVEVKKVPVMQLQRSSDWNYPPLTLLENIEMKPVAGNIQKRMELIDKTLGDFGIDVTMTDVRVGPTVSQYQLKPAEGVKLNAITARQDDLALALAAQSLRVEAPIPGMGLVGIEIPNEKKAMVGLREIIKSPGFAALNSKLAIALGRTASGEAAVADLARMPHCLIAGSTGSGKSVAINTIILSLLINNSPDELRMVLVDPKRVELAGYNGLPHLLTPVITEPKDTVTALKRMVDEMERRYKLLASHGKRNIEQYNAEPDLAEGKLPFIVIVIDELADLMMVSARDVESKIVRLAQMARAVGIHLIVATQRPSVDVITGLIKANIPTRIAFAVTSQVDSRTIIDSPGAEKLLGYGDMLYLSTEVLKPRRIQGAFCSEKEIQNVISHIRIQEPGDRYDPTFLEEPVESRFGGSGGGLDPEEEALVREAYDLFIKHNKASTSMLQTYLRLGYNKAKRIVAAMEERGMIGPERGGKQREVYHVDSGSEADTSTPVVEVREQGIAAYPENE
ncbi:MAG TPA: DNA translocase FtsK 4TM domain-containing protein [Verrucomicrobiae bacterium]|nr:DNA translocase FtsK 4TM domain-containing protein [Verrucomicrobiae bacterium]